MFSFFRKKDYRSLCIVDVHSHILPSLDDGVANLQESMDVLSAMQSFGYKKIIATPHIMSDVYSYDILDIKARYKLLEDEVLKSNLDIGISLAAEYYLDEFFMSNLQQNILAIDDKYILFETSYISKPMDFEDMVFYIKSLGYTPLMAHPERYRYIKEYKEYHSLKKMGILFQLDINSVVGYYGEDAYKKALFLIKNGLVDFVGSDIHKFNQIESLKKAFSSKIYRKIFNFNDILNSNFIS